MIGILIMTLIAFVLSVVLVYAEYKFEPKENKSEKYLKFLPGYNCGACGFGSCKGMSEAMADDVNNYKKCKPLKGDSLEKMEEYLNIKDDYKK